LGRKKTRGPGRCRRFACGSWVHVRKGDGKDPFAKETGFFTRQAGTERKGRNNGNTKLLSGGAAQRLARGTLERGREKIKTTTAKKARRK